MSSLEGAFLRRHECKNISEKVNNYWLKNFPEKAACDWEKSSYMIGNLAAYELTEKKEYLSCALKWAQDNEWHFYNDDNFLTTNADSVLCGEVYLQLIDMFPKKGTEEHMKKTMEHLLADKTNDYWWWIDAIYMAMPLFHIMGKRYNDMRYYDKAYKLFNNTCIERGLYDKDEFLWYRDERFTPDKALTDGGKKIFWARGNGWVFAGLARTLDVIDESCRYYQIYKKIFCEMAKKIRSLARPDGGFTTGLLNPDDFPMSETSGTALFVLGFLIGMRIGILDSSYKKTALDGFEWITNNAISDEGHIGFVQGISWSPEKNWANYDFERKKESTKDYAVGVYLLILKEISAISTNNINC